MPTEETVTESYWTVCYTGGWIHIPYPCLKNRTVTKWCYQFDWLKEDGYVVYCHYTGCELGIKYEWDDMCFNIFGSKYFHNIKKCYKNKRHVTGTCDPL
jgi:hypothetical protein